MTAALGLLEEARRMLRDALAPALDGEARYRALLAANAVATAARDIALADRLAEARRTVAGAPARIRAGVHDEDAALYAALLRDAVLRAHVADPAAPTADERARWLTDAP